MEQSAADILFQLLWFFLNMSRKRANPKISYYFYIIGLSKILEKIKIKGVCITLANLNQLKLFRNIHMRGIGGTSMSGIAEMLKHEEKFIELLPYLKKVGFNSK